MNTPHFTPADEQVLRAQAFDATRPGALLHDVQAVLAFVGTDGIEAGGKHQVLPLKALGPLNERLARPLRLNLKRPQLKSNPYLQGLNLLLRASGLFQVRREGSRGRLAVDPAMLVQWQALNATERYFNLLEAWLIFGRPEMVGERPSSYDTISYKFLTAFNLIPRKGLRFTKPPARYEYIRGFWRDIYLVALADLFGVLRVQHPSDEVADWLPRAILHTPFGDALLGLIVERCTRGTALDPYEGEDGPEVEGQDAAWEDEGEDDPSVEFGLWQPIFQPYFPEWRRNLVPPGSEAREGVFVFKVSVTAGVWRRIAIPSTSDLDELVNAILRSIDFDSDHLYEFQYRDRFGATRNAFHSYCDEGPYGADVRIGRLPLDPGQSMELTYDFGDQWRFNVALERIDPPDPKLKRPRVLGKHGKAPKQYEF